MRSTSIDELPELINILIGDMSIVGPRPLLVEYLGLYNEYQKQRHNVRPGLTGLAQINGRNNTTWDERFNFDIKYIENITFLGDIEIIFQTVSKVLEQDGVSSNFCATMEDFKGSEKVESEIENENALLHNS